MAFTTPSVADFKAYFTRDFPYGIDPNTSVQDTDIAKAYQLANVNGQALQSLFGDQGSFTTGYLYLSAHFLVMNLRASSQGINGQFAFLEQNKGVDSVNTSFAIPPRILENPFWSMLMKTNYGAQFMQLILPSLAGQMFTVPGAGLTQSFGDWGGYWQIV